MQLHESHRQMQKNNNNNSSTMVKPTPVKRSLRRKHRLPFALKKTREEERQRESPCPSPSSCGGVLAGRNNNAKSRPGRSTLLGNLRHLYVSRSCPAKYRQPRFVVEGIDDNAVSETDENDDAEALWWPQEDDGSVCYDRLKSGKHDGRGIGGFNYMQARSRRVRPRVVQFSSQVRVKSIPNREDYSDDVKASLWNNRTQIKQAAKRNTAECAWEECDWQDAPEENEFLFVKGNWVHPAHILDL